jgi:dipeptidyl aminopeptidase/acylaminoacyl peptidase
MIKIGATEDIIVAAEVKMGVSFPEGLKKVWRISNGLELPGGWQLFPVYDPNEPRKTCNDIKYENTKGRWPYMEESFVSIAGGDTGNQLVLKRTGDTMEDTIYLWNHETNKTKKWGKDFDYLLKKAIARVTNIEKQIQRGIKRTPTAQQSHPADPE